MKEETCCEAALRYLKEGLAVVPVDMETKIPLIRWSDENYRWPTEEMIKKWFKRWPNAGVGILTGKRSNGRFVLDCDTKEGREYLINVRQLHEKTMVVETARNGHVHAHFSETQAESATTVSKIRKDFDTRGKGGYVVMPPSPGYKLLSKPEVEVLKVPNGMAKAKELLPPEEAKPEQQERAEEKSEEDSGTPSGLIKNHTRNAVLFDFTRMLRDQSYKKEEVHAIMKNIARLCGPSYTEEKEVKQLENTVDSVFSRSSGSTGDGKDGGAGKDRTEHMLNYAQEIPIYSNSNLESNVTQDLEWLCKPFLHKQGVTLLTATDAGGKTTLVFHLLRAICRQEPFLGYPTSPIGKVLYLTEDGPTRFNMRLRQHSLPNDFVSRIYHTTVKNWEEAAQEQLQRYIRNENISLVVVDTLSKFLRVKSQDDPVEVERGLQAFVAFAHQCNVAVLILHHSGKAANGNPPNPRGSTVITATANIRLSLARVPRESRQRILTMDSTKSEDDPVKAMVIELNQTGLHKIGWASDVKEEKDLERFKGVMCYGQDNALSPKDIAEKLGDPKIKPAYVRKTLNQSNDPQVFKLGTGSRGHKFQFYLERGVEAEN